MFTIDPEPKTSDLVCNQTLPNTHPIKPNLIFNDKGIIVLDGVLRNEHCEALIEYGDSILNNKNTICAKFENLTQFIVQNCTEFLPNYVFKHSEVFKTAKNLCYWNTPHINEYSRW